MKTNKEQRNGALQRMGGLAARGGVLAGVLAVVSCSGDSSSMNGAPVANSQHTVTGRIMGGQQPVTGSTVTIYVAGTATGLGAGDAVLVNPASVATLTTDGNGVFSFPSPTCPSGDPPVYLVATQGNSGSGNNPALALSAGLQHCSQLVSQQIQINIDEVTTVASVWALSQFLDPSGAHLGTTSSASGQTGLVNAAATIQNLADTTTGLAVGALTGGNAGTPPTATVNTLANILARCVNSSGTTAATDPCGILFTAAPDAAGTVPGTTLQAALNVARNPSNNVSTLFGLTSSSDPFQTPVAALSAAPDDWTLVIKITGGSALVSGAEAGAPAIDASGNVWIASQVSPSTVNGGNGFVLPISPLGEQGAPVVNGGIFAPQLVVIDASGQLWITNGDNSAVNGGSGSVAGIANDDVTPIAGSPFIGAADATFDNPEGIAVDSSGNIWVGDNNNLSTGSGRVTILEQPSYAATSFPITTTPAGAAPSYINIAFDASHNTWVGDFFNARILELPGGDATNQVFFDSAVYLPSRVQSLAVDFSGNVWASMAAGVLSVTELSNAGGGAYNGVNYPLTLPSATTNTVLGQLVLDGAGKPWMALNTVLSTQCVVVLNSSGANLSSTSNGAIGCLGASSFGTRTLTGLAVDSSGNLWASNGTGTTVFEIVGVAVPVQTPLAASGGYAQPL